MCVLYNSAIFCNKYILIYLKVEMPQSYRKEHPKEKKTTSALFRRANSQKVQAGAILD